MSITGPTATLAIGIDASGAKAGVDAAITSLQKLKDASAKATGTLGAGGVAAEGLGARLVRFGQAADGAAASHGKVTGETRRGLSASLEATQGWNRLENVMTNFGLATLGVAGPLGSLTDKLGGFAVGGVVTLAVTLGVAAIVKAFEFMNTATREAEKGLDALLKKADELREKNKDPLGVVRVDMASIQAAIEAQQRVVTAAEKAARIGPVTVVTLQGGVQVASVDAETLANRLGVARRRFRELQGAAAEFAAEQTRQTAEAADKAKRLAEKERADAKAVANERAAAARARANQLASLNDLERKNAVERAELTKRTDDDDAAALAVRQAAAERFLATLDDLTPVERQRAVAAAELTEQLVQQEKLIKSTATRTERLAVALKAALGIVDWRGLADTLTTPVEDLRRTRTPARNTVALPDTGLMTRDEMGLLLADKDVNAKRLANYQATAQAISTAMTDAFSNILSNGLSGFTEFFDGLVGLAKKAAAGMLAAFAFTKLGLDKLLAGVLGTKDENGNPIQGGLGLFGKGMTPGQQAGAGALVGGAVGTAVGGRAGSAAGGAALGALSGGAAGFAVGGPLGAAVGAVIGAIGGFLSAAKKAREAAEALKQARLEFEDALAAYTLVGKGQAEKLQAQLDQENRDYERIIAQRRKIETKAETDSIKAAGGWDAFRAKGMAAVDGLQGSIAEFGVAGGGLAAVMAGKMVEAVAAGNSYAQQLDEIDAAHLRRIAMLKLEYEVMIATNALGLQSRIARSSGDDTKAANLDLTISQMKETFQAIKDGWNAADIATLNYVQQLERETLAKNLVAAATKKAADLALTESSIAARESTLRGDAPEVNRVIMISAEFNQKMADAAAALARGDLTPALFDRLAGVLQGEMAQALKDVAAEATAAAAALAAEVAAAVQARANRMQDLDLRALQATGDTAGAAQLALRIKHEREWREAVAQGADAEELARIKYVHGLEDVALANDLAATASKKVADEAKALADELKKLADALLEQSRIADDLAARALDAAGNTTAGALIRFIARQKKEYEDAVAANWSQTNLDTLRDVLKDERKNFDRAQEAGAAAAAAAATSSTELQTQQVTATSIQAITSMQADTLASYLASIAINTAQTAYNTGQAAASGVSVGVQNAAGGTLGGNETNIVVNVNVAGAAGSVGAQVGAAVDRALATRANLRGNAAGSTRVV